ncbi:MAG: DUF5615 family PIN-like protein [Deltaproteobacteria bacterium]|nr:DUF5615 family PIN-like protein [Deltaproteobacteria bacterium]
MKILADIHISPITVHFLQDLGYDAIRVNEILPWNSSDKKIVETAKKERRVIITQDLDFSEIISLTGKKAPSLISLRLSSSRIEYVNKRLEEVLPKIEYDIEKGSIIVVEDSRIRVRSLPVQTL